MGHPRMRRAHLGLFAPFLLAALGASPSAAGSECTRTQECPHQAICAAGQCMDVSSPSIWESLLSEGLLPAICIPAGTSGSGLAFADYCFSNDAPCTPGCRVAASAHSLAPSFADAGSWGTAPTITLDYQLDASFAAPIDGEVLFIPFSCTAEVMESNAPGSYAISFAPDGTPSVAPGVPDLSGPSFSNCATLGDVSGLANDLADGLNGQMATRIEEIGGSIEEFVQPVPEPDRRALLGVALLALGWRARRSRREAAG